MNRDWEVVQKVDPEMFRVYLIIRYVSILGIGAHACFIPMFWALGVPWMAAFNFFSVAAWIQARRLNQAGSRDQAVGWITAEVVLHAILATVALGWDSGFQNYLIPMIPFTIFNQRLSTRRLWSQTAGLCLSFLMLYGLARGLHPIAGTLLKSLYLTNTVVVFSALGLISYYFRQASLTAEQAMSDLANRDALTGLPNRRYLRQVLQAQQTRTAREGGSFCVAIGDIDHFKSFNDTHGHDCGDLVLKETGAVLRAGLRGDDTVGRWGGEEFLLVLSFTDLQESLKAVDRVRQALENTRFQFQGQQLRVTMTFGVAQYGPQDELEATLNLADERLYQGKKLGRNRVVAGD